MKDDSSQPLLERFPALRKLRFSKSRGIPYIQQTTATDCGAACLTMVLEYFGKPLELRDVRDAMGVTREGITAHHILEAAQGYGLQGRGLQLEEVRDLALLPPATILHWRFCHFVVLERVTRTGAWIVDPGMGRGFFTWRELDTSFTGVAITLEPDARFEGGGRRKSTFGPLLAQVLGESKALPKVVVISLLIQFLSLAVPVVTGLLIDRVIPRGEFKLLSVLMVGAIGIIGFRFISSLVRAYLLLELRSRLDVQMATRFLDHLVDLPYLFFQQRSSGDLMMRLNSNSTIREILTSGALSALLDGSLVTLYLILLFLLSPSMGLLVAGLGLLRVLLFLIVRRRQSDLMSQTLQSQASARSFEFQLLEGIESIKAAGAERRAVEIWSNLFVKELNVSIARGRLDGLVDALLATLSAASPLVILLVGGVLVIQGSLSLGTMLALSALAGGFLAPLATLVATAFQVQLLGSYLARLNDVLETEREQEETDLLRPPQFHGAITLRNVTFRYSPWGDPAVRDVSVEIKPGQMVAIVGGSGSGKSTLLGLMAGLYHHQEGQILFDDTDLFSLDLRYLRSRLGYVPQTPHFFGASVRSNIELGSPGLPFSRIEEAAQDACIYDDIMKLPMGFQTALADNATSLSGGQRQRLALAKALVRQPRIMLLDEATSALDTVTERKVERSLASKKCTRVVIAHRLSTIREADLILVMEGGKVVERGTHRALLALEGVYQTLVAAQLGRED